MRKPISMVAVRGEGTTSEELAVLCDDGTVFFYVAREGYWSDAPPIPGTPADPDASEESKEHSTISPR